MVEIMLLKELRFGAVGTLAGGAFSSSLGALLSCTTEFISKY
jgi:hypothetical protein